MDNAMTLESETKDFSNFPSSEERDNFLLRNSTHAIIFGAVFLFINVAGIVGNALVIFAVVLSRKLQTTTNVFVVNLSLSDFCACCALLLNIYMILHQGGKEDHLPDWLCISVAVVTLVSTAACIFTLSLIGVNRYFKITKSAATYQKVYSKGVIAIMIAASWLYPACLMGISLAITDGGTYGYSERYRVCFRSSTGENSKLIKLLADVLLVIPTLIVTLMAYVLIYIHIRRHNKRRLANARMRAPHPSPVLIMEPPDPMVRDGGVSAQCDTCISREVPTKATASVPVPSPGTTGEHQAAVTPRTNDRPDVHSPMLVGQKHQVMTPEEERIRKVQMQITRSLFLIVVLHFILMTPFIVVIVIRGINRAIVPWVFLLFAATLALNPLIYGWKHPHFKVVLRAMLTCRWAAIPEPTRAGRCACCV